MMYVSGDILILKDFFGYGEPAADIMMYRRVIEGFLAEKTIIIINCPIAIAKKSDSILVFKNKTVIQYPSFK